ncbi:DUF4349 domain-containing protein [Angustibacter sp. McL0619]|uniref:DUF4349 domain-containing protein n=1 Tax=Angustibacter sp. McL0619 TaxID=3415676 RepID=UPI003CF4C2ED
MTRTRSVLAASALLATVLLTGCGGSSDGADSSGSSGAQSQSDAAGGVAQPGSLGEKAAAPQSGDPAADSGGGAASSDAAAAFVAEQKVVKTAAMSVRTGDVDAAAATVRSAVQQAKGFIADEKTTSNPQPGAQQDQAGYTQSVLTARVPNDSLDAVMAAVARTGTVLSRAQSSDDVTSQYVDTQSRVRTQTASVERVRLLLSKATSIGQVVQIESELSRREADLESLEAQLKALDNQTTLSTLTVDLSPKGAPVPPRKDEDTGFLSGLSAGWTALLASLTVVLTVLGAMLPFLVLLALLGVPALVWARRQRAARAAGTTPVDPGQPQPQPAP